MQGGNAADASVVSFALTVVLPAAPIGGGGFMVIHDNELKKFTIDYQKQHQKS